MTTTEMNVVIGILTGLAITLPISYIIGVIPFGWKFKKFRKRKVMATIYTVIFTVFIVMTTSYHATTKGLEISYEEPPINQDATYDITQDVDVLVLGDSLAAGMQPNTYYSDYNGPAYEYYLELETMGNNGWYQNWALPGDTSTELTELLYDNPTSEEFAAIQADNYQGYFNTNPKNMSQAPLRDRQSEIMPDTDLNTLIEDAEVIYISIGGNDVLQMNFELLSLDYILYTLYNMNNNVNDAIAYIHMINPDVEIYLNMMFYPYIAYGHESQALRVGTDMFNIELRSASETNENVYLVYPPEELNTEIEYFDGVHDVHPGISGYKLMGQQLYESFVYNSKYVTTTE